MNSERLIKMVIMDYTSDILKIEEELEKTINGDLEINRKVQKIKDLLSLMVTTETSLSKFTSMTNNNNNNTD
jgi:hypothetical protein